MTRRDAIKALGFLLGTAVTPSVANAVMSGARPVYGGSLSTLTPAQAELVATLAEMIIPKTDTPGAREVGVDRFVDAVLTNGYTPEERDRFLKGLADVDVRSGHDLNTAFLKASLEQQLALLKNLQSEAMQPRQNDASGDQPQPFFSMLKELTVVGYYTSEIGATQELRYVVMPGYYDGDLPFHPGDRAWA